MIAREGDEQQPREVNPEALFKACDDGRAGALVAGEGRAMGEQQPGSPVGF